MEKNSFQDPLFLQFIGKCKIKSRLHYFKERGDEPKLSFKTKPKPGIESWNRQVCDMQV